MDEVARSLARADADAVVLQEVTRAHGEKLRQSLESVTFLLPAAFISSCCQTSDPCRRPHRPAGLPALDLAHAALGAARCERESR
jgi:hypothetical protein